MITGARQGIFSGLRRLVSLSMARDLGVYIIPGAEIARFNGLDIEAAGMNIVATPRHASVLLVVGDIPPALCEAAAVIYAQMMRPRVLFSLGVMDLSPLPVADIVADLSQSALVDGVLQLRTALAKGAFEVDVEDFEAPNLQIRIEYVCPMHAEVVKDKPGSCPKCGMTLIPREAQISHALTQAEQESTESDDHAGMDHGMNHDRDDQTGLEYSCPMHPEVVQSEPGSCPKCGMNLEPRKVQADSEHQHHDMDHKAALEYSCPMHPEVVQSEPGSCPKCGMNLEPRKVQADSEYQHHDHDMDHKAALEYSCPMHPEVVQSEAGSCPKCGMNLEPRKVQADSEHQHHDMDHKAALEYSCPMHPEVVQSESGSCPKCGMNLEPRKVQADSEHQHHDHDHDMDHKAALEYSCPMHPEVVQSEAGSCPKCGMNLEPRETQSMHNGHAGLESRMDHTGMDHSEMGFMSMVEVTKDLPRSGDGLPMDWIKVPFGPFFPGLPGGLSLTFTLDGDTVAGSEANTLVGNGQLLLTPAMKIKPFIKRLASLQKLAPVSYQVLACIAIENAAAIEADSEITKARAVAVEQERIVSHLGWLALFAQQTGFDWLLDRAASLQRDFLQADCEQIVAMKTAVFNLTRRLRQTPLLNSRTQGIGKLDAETSMTLLGPVARAAGINQDARTAEPVYQQLGFVPAIGKKGDVRTRLQLRLDEISDSIALIEKANLLNSDIVNVFKVCAQNKLQQASGSGQAVLETPRGLARLQLSLEKGQVVRAQLETPSTHHIALIESLTAQQELGDALVVVGSLDLSPWEIAL